MPRILILHATVGTGHKSAAHALEAACHRLSISAVVKDIFDYALPIVRTAYVEPYLALTARAPDLFGAYYKVSDQESALQKELRMLLDQVSVDKVDALLAETQPDIIICTHYLPAGVLSKLKKRGHLPQPLLCVLTDYAAHAQWVYSHLDAYFVAAPHVREQLISRGISAPLIRVTGIPVHPQISDEKDVAAVRQALRLPSNQPNLTLFGGGMDTNHVRQIVAELLGSPIQGALTVISGRNTDLPRALRAITSTPTLRLAVHRSVNNVDDWITASNLVITKPGGLIVSEVLARGVPLIVTATIPGHEEHNADYVVTCGAGLSISVPSNVPTAVSTLIFHPERLDMMRRAARAAGRPQAAYDIVRAAVQIAAQH